VNSPERVTRRWRARVQEFESAYLHYGTEYEPGPLTQVAGMIWTMKFTVAVTHEAPWYVARCLDVDVVSQGETVDDAVANLEEALGL
jgi:hypothetical protein